jgi:hypothetical protein
MAISNAFKFANNIISNGKFDANDLSVSVTGGPSLQAVKTSGFTAVANEAYPCNTTSAGFTVTLPATPSAGDEVIVLDYAGTFDTNALVISPNGGKIEGATSNLQLSGEREGVRLVYIDSTQGWLAYSGINEGTDALGPVPYSVDFLVVAGGGGGGSGSAGVTTGGGGGAGGYRTSTQTILPGTVITVTVGDGGAGGSGDAVKGTQGSDSSISGSGLTTITSTGGGGGGGNYESGAQNPTTGGSGGGGAYNVAGAAGNTPSTSPAQGFAGGAGSTSGPNTRGGGGGASEAGNTDGQGYGGDGTASSITGSSVTRAGGGGGGNPSPNNTGGDGGGGTGANGGSPTAGTANTGGGGGGTQTPSTNGGNGGKGVVILRMPDANYSGTFTGSPTVITGVGGTHTVITFEESGSYTT